MIEMHHRLTAMARLFITIASFGSAFAMLWLNILNVIPQLPLGEFVFCIIIGILTYPRLTVIYDGEGNGKETEQGTHGSAPSGTIEG